MTSMSHLLGSEELVPPVVNVDNVDRLSTLPQNVLNNIYGNMTIVDAVKMSVLAKDWRYRWLSQSRFTFDSNVIARRLNRELSWEIVASAVTKFLRHHTNSIKSFSLKALCSGHYPDMYQWIEYLAKQDVEVLSIQDLCNSYFKTPSCLFSFENLKSLSLMNCAIRVPSTFAMFVWLDELILRNVSISDGDLALLIRSCPRLKQLKLFNISGLKSLIIQAPKLSKLIVDSGFEDFFIDGDANELFHIIIKASREPGDRAVFNWHRFIHCLSDLRALQILVLPGDIIKFLAADYGLGNFPLRNAAMENLILTGVRFENVEVFRVCLSLLSSCHNIRCFRFSIESSKSPKLLAKFIRENWGKFCFSKLEEILVKCPADVDMGCVKNFIDFVISQSPSLVSLTILKRGPIPANCVPILNYVERLKSSCPHASISYMVEDPDEAP